MEGKKGVSLANSIGGPRGWGVNIKGVSNIIKKVEQCCQGSKKKEASYPTYIKQNRKKAGYLVVIRCCLFLKNSRIESLCVVPRKKNGEK